jgi:hypothetical protein
MAQLFVEAAVSVLWAAVLAIHTRRLLRLASVAIPASPRARVRARLHRVWFWLGREEFWRGTQHDCLYGMQLTLMLFALGLGAAG